MIEKLKALNQRLSVRLSIKVVSAMAVLLMLSLAVMLYFSRTAVKEEALEKASMTLEGTVECIDNILLSVEQTAGNFYVAYTINPVEPDLIHTYSRRMVESNPYIVGCAIAFKKDFFKDHEYFMAYYYREKSKETSDSVGTLSSKIVQSDHLGNTPYTEQSWFTKVMASGKPCWVRPQTHNNSESDPVITFSLPLSDSNGQPIGAMGVNVSLAHLSRVIEAAKPSPNSYCILLDSDGSFIVHPEGSYLIRQTVFSLSEQEAEPSIKEAAQAMISGENGYRHFRFDGEDYYVFYKPFQRVAVAGRSMEELNWSAGIFYPEDDIFGDYNSLFYYVLAIAIVGLLLLFLLSVSIVHRQLKPLLLLTESAQRIAKGHYEEPIPDSRQKDEIGRLQHNFQQMQQSLATHIGELEQLTTTLQERGEGLRVAYHQAQKAERMKTTFLHNMTNQMTTPAIAIDKDVQALCSDDVPQDMSQLTGDIQRNGTTITNLLNNLITMSEEEIGKEGTYV